MKYTLLFAVLLLSGCAASLEGKFDNRVACTAAGDKAFIVSEWGPVGITGILNKADAKAVCK